MSRYAMSCCKHEVKRISGFVYITPHIMYGYARGGKTSGAQMNANRLEGKYDDGRDLVETAGVRILTRTKILFECSHTSA